MSTPDRAFVDSYHAPTSLWKAHLSRALEEDQWHWDWTTRGALVDPAARNRVRTARVIAKSDGIWAADGLDATVVALAAAEGFKLECRNSLGNGATFKPGDTLTRWQGPAHALLVFERAYLNLASWASGIATRTRRSVDIIDRAWAAQSQKTGHAKPRLTATRKTLPGFRDISVQAVMAGGGFSHRTSLAGGVLIKENHIAAAGGIRAAVVGARGAAPHGLRIEIEVRNQQELEEAFGLDVDCIMLDNYRPEEIQAALAWIAAQGTGRKPCIEASGGISEASLASFVIPGVDIISSGALTHSVTSSDFSMLIDWS